MQNIDRILLAHGGGGILTRRLIEDEIVSLFNNDILNSLNDCAIFSLNEYRLAFTTDSYVVTPIFFNGGDIGKLAVCGTINDLAMSGAKPLYLSCALILEEGFPIKDLQRVLLSIQNTAKSLDISIITGDTKVVEKNAAENIYINMAGIGLISSDVEISSNRAEIGDIILLNGTIGDHGIAILSERKGMQFQTIVQSDVAPLSGLIDGLLKITCDIHCLRDPTRGGLATALNEIARASNVGIRIYEDKIPINPSVQGACDMLGLDPLDIANEGKVIIICPKKYKNEIIDFMKSHPYGNNTSVIGEIIAKPKHTVLLRTRVGGDRLVDIPYGEDLPRIC